MLVAVPDSGLGTLGTCPGWARAQGPPQERASTKVDIKKIYLGCISYYLPYFVIYVIIMFFLLKSIDKKANNQSKTITSIVNIIMMIDPKITSMPC